MAELAKVTHPNIMGYYGYKKDESGLYFFVEFCSGGSLKQLIGKKMSELKVITLVRQLLDAMSYINKLSNDYLTQTNFIVISSPIISSLTKTKNSRSLTLDSLVMWKYRWQKVHALPYMLPLKFLSCNSMIKNVMSGVQAWYYMRCSWVRRCLLTLRLNLSYFKRLKSLKVPTNALTIPKNSILHGKK